jgi:hypothetical protein
MSTDFEMPTQTKGKSKVAAMTEQSTKPPTESEEKSPSQTESEKPKYTQAELLQVFDDLMFSGSYTESYNIRGKLKVAFKTRTAEEMNAITRQIDDTSAVLMATLVERRNLLNLYYALVSYQGKDLSVMKIEDKTSFVNKLAAPIVGMLMVELYKFDTKVDEATKEGEANF